MTTPILDTFLDDEVVPQPGNFDPMTMVPTTDEQVKYALSKRPTRSMACSMWGHYCCNRHLGKSVIDAWVGVLKVSIGKE